MTINNGLNLDNYEDWKREMKGEIKQAEMINRAS
jgi:hypothetical protein